MAKTKIVKRLSNKGFPQASKFYQEAHRQADKAEKAKFPSGYEAMKKIDAKIPKGELAGKNLANGKIEVSAKVPAKYRAEVAFHEKQEHQNIARLRHVERLKRGK